MIFQVLFMAVLGAGPLPEGSKPPGDVSTDTPVYDDVRVAAPIDPRDACPIWRHVALKKNPTAECPDPGTVNGEAWRIRHLFKAQSTTARVGSADYALALPPALRPFCLYEYKKNDPETLDLLEKKLYILSGLTSSPSRVSLTPPSLASIESSCAAVGPAEENTPASLSETEANAERFFLQQAGDFDSVLFLGRRHIPGQDPPSPRVQLSILDTQPTSTNNPPSPPGTSRHGHSLAQIARKLLCKRTRGTAGCVADINYFLALPIIEFDRYDVTKTRRNFRRGGFSGSIDALATAVWNAVSAWTESRPIKQQHLVLNLSVAWNGKHFGGLENEVERMPVSVQAMHRALEVANCEGALVIAAAGNLKGGPVDESDALLPGAWEKRDAPSPIDCPAILRDNPPPLVPDFVPQPEPLLYAVGGVRFDNLPLYNSRPDGEPRLVAAGNHASVVLPSGPTKPLTGTSVSTIVGSATASAVWHHWPDLTRAKLMKLLYETSESIDRAADFYHPVHSGSHTVHRVAVCPVLKNVCDKYGGGCTFRCQDPPTQRPNFCWAETPCSKTVDASLINHLLIASFCGNREILYDPTFAPPEDPCPSKQYHGATSQPWDDESTLPQPTDDPCSACGPAGSGGSSEYESIGTNGCPTIGLRNLRIEIDEAWNNNEALSQIFLDIDHRNMTFGVSLALGIAELKREECILIENFNPAIFPDIGPNPYVTLRFRGTSGRAHAAPLPAF